MKKKMKLPWKFYKHKDGKPICASLDIRIGGDEYPLFEASADVWDVVEPDGKKFCWCLTYENDTRVAKTFDSALAQAEKKILARMRRIQKIVNKYV